MIKLQNKGFTLVELNDPSPCTTAQTEWSEGSSGGNYHFFRGTKAIGQPSAPTLADLTEISAFAYPDNYGATNVAAMDADGNFYSSINGCFPE